MKNQNKWSSTDLLKAIRQLHRQGYDLSYNALARTHQAIISASAYYFGSYRKAVVQAGFDYDQIRKKPKWSEQKIVAVIRKLRRDGEDLNWRSVILRRDEVGRAASAAVKPHLFGSWNEAVEAAGLNPRRVSRYRRWTAEEVVTVLRQRNERKLPINALAIQRELPGLYTAAVRHYGAYDFAIREADIDPATIRQRRIWSRPQVSRYLRAFERTHGHVTRSLLRKHDPGLLRAIPLYYPTVSDAFSTLRLRTTPPTRQGRLFKDDAPYPFPGRPRPAKTGRKKSKSTSRNGDRLLFAMA
ncbi:MAG: hypothetical protein IT447_16510 [Phycisphaerales bacterium]|jgi:hypothetical protein|nr:hypothetical protein [Phycisphaerales bacterium]